MILYSWVADEKFSKNGLNDQDFAAVFTNLKL